MSVAANESISVIVEEHLTEEQFHHVGTMLAEPLGRYKSHSTDYVFDVPRMRFAELLAYLRSQHKPYRYEAAWHPSEAAPTGETPSDAADDRVEPLDETKSAPLTAGAGL